MFYQLNPALSVYKQLPGIRSEAMGAVATGTGQHSQCAQLSPLILEGARSQAFSQAGYRFVDCIARIHLRILFLMAIHTDFTQHIDTFLQLRQG